MPKNLPTLGALELEVMLIAWELEDVTVSDVLGRLPGDRHHNTVMTVMGRLAGKGYLERYDRAGRAKGYRPRVAKDAVSREVLGQVKAQFFGGSLRRTLAALLGNDRRSPESAARIERLLAELEEDPR